MNEPDPAPIDEHAKAIGYVCIYWAALEHGINRLLEAVTPLEPGQISDSITANADMRDKLQMLRAVSFVRRVDDRWFERLESIINHINSDLRPKRNRFVHDAWVGVEPIKRRTVRTSITRPKARIRELTTYEDVPVKAADIWSFVQEISHAQIRLSIFEQDYRKPPTSRPKSP